MTHEKQSFLEARPVRARPISRFHEDWYVLSRLRELLSGHITNIGLDEAASVLDFGCADSPYRDLFSDAVGYRGADLDGNTSADVRINSDGSLPVDSASLDLVLSTQVLEHVGDPKVYLSEARRVLKPNGSLILSTHGVWPYHADPVDYWRWTAQGLRRQIELAGFDVVASNGIGGLLAMAVQLWQADSAKRLPGAIRVLYCYVLQRMIKQLDRFYSEPGRERGALVYVMTAMPKSTRVATEK